MVILQVHNQLILQRVNPDLEIGIHIITCTTFQFGVKLPGFFSRELFSDSEVIYIGNSETDRLKELPLAPKRSVAVLMKDGSFMRYMLTLISRVRNPTIL